MILVLCSATDVPALWLAGALSRLGETVKVLTVEELAAAGLQHRIEGGGTSFVVDRPDGTRLDAADVDLVVDRVVDPPGIPRSLVAPADRDYAEQEIWAVTLGWLASFEACGARIVNPPAPSGLAGRDRSDLEWRALAVRAGLPVAPGPTAPWSAGPVVASIAVVGEAVVGLGCHPVELAPPLRAALARLAASARLPLLGVALLPTPSGPAFVGADLLPDLHLGGLPLVEGVAALVPARPASAVPEVAA